MELHVLWSWPLSDTIHNTHTHTHTHTHTYTFTHMHTHAHTHMHTHTCTHTHAHTHMHTHTYIYMHTHAHTHTYTCTHTHMHTTQAAHFLVSLIKCIHLLSVIHWSYVRSSILDLVSTYFIVLQVRSHSLPYVSTSLLLQLITSYE